MPKAMLVLQQLRKLHDWLNVVCSVRTEDRAGTWELEWGEDGGVWAMLLPPGCL